MTVVAAEPVVEIKKKLFYKINEVSKITGLKPYVLRYWETEFPQLSPEKDDSDQRRYRRKDIDLVLRIKKLLYEEKYTIAGAKQKIASEMGGTQRRSRAPQPAPSAKAAAPTRAPSGKRIPRILAEIGAIRSELKDLLAYIA